MSVLYCFTYSLDDIQVSILLRRKIIGMLYVYIAGRSSVQFQIQCDKYLSDICNKPTDLGDLRTVILSDIMFLKGFLIKYLLHVRMFSTSIHRTLTGYNLYV